MRAFAVVTAGFVVSLSSVADARPEYPGELQETQGMPCAPTCMICHTVPEGGDKNLKDDFFGIPLGAKSNANAELNGDYDKDGKTDGEELKAGTNPIIPGSVSVCAPEYGCGARVAKAPAPGGLQSESLLLGALGFGVLLRWQLRRRTNRRR